MSRTNLIVGGSTGIGRELAMLLSSSGEVVFEASRKKQESNSGLDIKHFDFDVTEETSLPKEIEKLDGLAYMPGTINLKPFHRLTTKDFLEEFQLNVLGAVHTIQEALPLLKKGRNPSIVLFSTVAVSQGMSFHASTASAKGAIEGLVRSLAAEFAPKIRVNAIAPSIVRTRLAARLLSSEAKIEASAKRHPLQRVGNPSEIAEVAKMLLAPDTWITGQIIRVDGGMSGIKSL